MSDPDTAVPSADLQNQLLNALQSSSSRPKPASQRFSSLAALKDSENSTNTTDLLCPQKECSSVILRKGAAVAVERPSILLQPEDAPNHSLLPALPSPPDPTDWWLVTPSMMQFENIGFTRPVERLPLSPSGKKLKLLACAECDLGPLGWCEEGGNEFFVVPSRVAYREGYES